jgi:hypothetical protein
MVRWFAGNDVARRATSGERAARNQSFDVDADRTAIEECTSGSLQIAKVCGLRSSLSVVSAAREEFGPSRDSRYTADVRVDGRGRAARQMRIALDLFDLGERMLRQRLRRARPGASAAEIEAAVVAWRLARPGAEPGDAPGHRRPWPPT